MTVSYPLDLPSSPEFSEATFTKEDRVASFQSPFTGEQQFFQHSGQIWSASLTLPPMTENEARDWAGWLASLNGRKGTFKLYDPYGKQPRGTGGGDPKVDTGTVDSTGTELDTKGWNANEEVLKRGDYLEVSDELKIVTQDVSSDGSGEATVSLEPAVRATLSDGDNITVDKPRGIFRLSQNRVEWTEVENIIDGLSFAAREDLSS